MDNLWGTVLGGLLGSGFVTALSTTILLRHNTRIETEIKRQVNEGFKLFESKRVWQEKCLSELLGPVVMQLERTGRAFARWSAQNLYLEAKIIREGNSVVRDLLLANGHLIPPELFEHASALVEHYDYWLELFDKKRASSSFDDLDKFVFAAPDGFAFPHGAEAAFKSAFRRLQKELYAI